MNNSDFFQNALGAKLKNSRWSWGAKSTDTKRIFLRVWKKDIPDSGDRVRISRVGRENRKALGYQERKEHVKELRNGTEGYGVVCTAKKDSTSSRAVNRSPLT